MRKNVKGRRKMNKNRKGNEKNEKCKGKGALKKLILFRFSRKKPLKLFRGLPEWEFLPGKG